ncbi:3-phosphonopyruvate decarboxylase [Burkholderia lata]|uniref:3-phosphonopyruvate decarboxylase n=1 Tax=Burkholderia lata (strain ATCC 17760 / DSM 23089 / LMG 22485 / NCIMB 9086 / R18194 / 383) TaxID=482957 RepID=A0A6P2VL32_BURL3|nr:phosphonopyruvate decarboxylase [Burkholderia lata]VWC88837.1 3-phosphonopyruvate decarboxylase [Burkholderia lata]
MQTSHPTASVESYDFGAPGVAAEWPEEIHALLKKFDVRQAAYVPDGGLARLIERIDADDSIRTLPLTTEEEGVGVIAGAWLGGQRAVLLMQSSGVGNCVNLFSLIRSCTMPAVILVTMRGEWGEFVPWQIPMGQATRQCFELFDFAVIHAATAEDVAPSVEAALKMAFYGYKATAVLISQRVIGAKSFGKF